MMSVMIDQEYLRQNQYHTGDNLDARILIHRRFGTNTYGWFRWVYDHLTIEPGAHLLDIGCGTAAFWHENHTRLPADVSVTLSDLSFGMVQQSRLALTPKLEATFLTADAQYLPFPSGCMQGVLANHMLYHVPDIARGVAELQRVLAPGGWLCAATNGFDHLAELYALVEEFLPGYRTTGNSAARFGLQNGVDYLGPVFGQVETHYYEGDLWITEAQPLVAYIKSMWQTEALDAAMAAEMQRSFESRIRQSGGIAIHKSTGIFLARR
ncbi:MAG TPA: class I SAM-dependent methyltransferase [Anaerolineaceae bacterium]|nr:class I SAM-dependent methyltransferase [Anaerolineaceae bacterium]